MTLIVIFIVFAILSFAVSSKLKSKFKKYSRETLMGGLSGAEIAEKMLKDNGIYDVRVVPTRGELTDHYNPANKTVNLSEQVYYGRSASAAAVAAHECGHAVQHAKAYSFLEFRTAMVPIQNISAKILNFIMLASIFGGFFFLNVHYSMIILVVIGAYFVITLFSLVTLPVEFDASKRALAWMSNRGVTNTREQKMAKDALNWAAMTYVVAALGSLVTLLYFVSIFLGGRD